MAERYRLIYEDGFLEDLRELAEQAENDASAARRVRVALNALEELKLGTERGTHKLGFMTTYPDLSDCETTYLGVDPVRRPEARLVWRENPGFAWRTCPRRPREPPPIATRCAGFERTPASSNGERSRTSKIG